MPVLDVLGILHLPTECSNNYNQLRFLESLLIKRYIPQLNYGIKAAKELVLF